ncbi:hypothetical protein PRIO_5261 [Paenibacillus riograndensis SBR5]|uniref:Uncharacterized protein n=1 Tax=Paenibacillus riograndensis SBR5 TaxID=1073571 RepID=A0A0E4HED4_9BACL|nr:hypothetical protein PRIO_5261 [Paenibacillus riograndensis SBR5]
MMNIWNGTGEDSWLKPYNGKVPLQAYYDQFRYIPEQSSGKQEIPAPLRQETALIEAVSCSCGTHRRLRSQALTSEVSVNPP